MKMQRVDSGKHKIIGYLNINSFRKKFVYFEDVIKLFTVFLVFESKLNKAYPNNQFRINRYTFFRYDLR